MRTALLIIISFVCWQGMAQNKSVVDSLKSRLNNSTSKEDKAEILMSLSHEFRVSSPDSSMYYSDQSLMLFSPDTTKEIYIRLISARAAALSRIGEYTEARKLSRIAQRFYKRTNQEEKYVGALFIEGVIDKYTDNLNDGIEKYLEGAKILEKSKLKNLSLLSEAYGMLGQLFQSKGEDESALEFIEKELGIAELLKSDQQIGHSLTNLGIAYSALDRHEEAKDCYERSIIYKRKLGDSLGVAINLNNVSGEYSELGDEKAAVNALSEAYIIAQQVNSNLWLAITEVNLGDQYLQQKNYKQALHYLTLSLEKAVVLDYGELISAIYQTQMKTYAEMGDYKSAYTSSTLYFEKEMEMIRNNSSVAVTEMKTKYETEKKDNQIKELNHQQELQNAQLIINETEAEQSKMQKYYLFAGLGLTGLFSLFLFNRFRITRKQKHIIEEQKGKVDLAFDQLESKNHEILDSINYAKRIQSAILPPTTFVKSCLPDSFILYLPKDIVAGDFYWMEKVGDKILFAAADCTGHGVPGALVSVICHNALNRSVREFKLTDPGKILDKTRELVIEQFEKSQDDVKDGMDISLCSLEGSDLFYAGAHNPLLIYREEQGILEEVKADKEPIGKFANHTPFTTHKLKVNQNDSIYLFTDGFVDQFGGDKGKKFKSTNFKQLLQNLQENSIAEQEQILTNTFEDWKGHLEQLDDICILGVKV